ncbi:MAG: hypothetical protein HY268_05245 [Deltaproteobacteria bacterium]|nr:hypothetical protein [Deltaproteobacteria bacterium]
MTKKQGLTKCVEFTTGAVAFIGYKLARIDLTPYGLGVAPGYIIVMLRCDRAKPVCFSGCWDQRIPGYYATKSSHAGESFYVALSHTKPKEHRRFPPHRAQPSDACHVREKRYNVGGFFSEQPATGDKHERENTSSL